MIDNELSADQAALLEILLERQPAGAADSIPRYPRSGDESFSAPEPCDSLVHSTYAR
jgi:hypothetical protein